MAYPFPIELQIGCRVRTTTSYSGEFTGTLLALHEPDRAWPACGTVLPDDSQPDRTGDWRAPAIDVREIARIAEDWLHPLGLVRVDLRRPLAPEAGCIRFDARRRQWCLMNRQDRGWASSCVGHDTIGELLATWGLSLQVDELDRNRIRHEADSHGRYWSVRRAG